MSTYTDASLIVTPNSKKAGKLYALKGADLDVVRATTATYVGSDGLIKTALANEVRFDYTNGSCPSILVEPQRTNILLNSESFAGSFGYNQCSITSNQTAPDGSNNAKRITNGTTTTDVFFEQSVSFTPNTYTWSIFVKKGTDTVATIKPVHVGIAGDVSLMTFNFATETITSYGGIISSGYKKYANGWYRIFCSVVITSSVVSLRGRFGNSNTPNVYNDWAFPQLEAGSYATSYIPTTSASVTRNADVISKTGISSLIGQTEGTMFIDINYKEDSVFKNFFNLGTSTSSYIAIVARNNNKIGAEVLNAGVQVNNEGSTIYTSQRLKIAFAYKANDFAMYINGVLAFSQSSGTVPAKAEVYLGSYGNGTQQSKDGIKSAALWKTRLSNTELATLTTI